MFLIVGLWSYLRFLLVVGFAFSIVQDVRAIRHGVPGLVDIVIYQALFLFLLLGGHRRVWVLWRYARRCRSIGGTVAAIALCGLAASATAHDVQAALHDIPWYMQHRAERDATLNWCHMDESRTRMSDCRNAEAAGNERVLSQPMAGDFLADSRWWRANPMVRDGVLRICANPTQPGAAVYLRYCRYAASGF